MTVVARTAAEPVYNVQQQAVVGAGADDSAAIQNLVNKIPAAGGVLYIPDGVNLKINSVTINNANIRIHGGPGAKITGTGSNPGLLVTAAREITGLTIDSARIKLNTSLTGPLDIHDNNFTGTSGGAINGLNDSAGNWPSHVTIRHNAFVSQDYGIYGDFSDTLIEGNTFTGPIGATRRNMEFGMGSRNRIIGNTIDGGVTAIIWLTQRLRGNYSSLDNVVIGNTIQNVSEEAISTDLHGNATGASGSVVNGTISSGLTTSSGYVQFIPSFSLSVANAYVDLYVVMLSGAAKGEVSRVTSMGAGGTTHLETTATNLNGYTVGDKLILVSAQIGWIVQGNTIRNAQTGVNSWGCTYGALISDNHITDCSLAGVKISSLFGMIDGYYGPCYHNQIHSNTLVNANITIDSEGPASGTIDSIGNQVYDNALRAGSQIIYTKQEAYQVWDNTIFGDYGHAYDRVIDFETGTVAANFDSVSDPGSKFSIDTVVFNGGANSLKKATGNTATGTYTIPAGHRLLTIRFAFYMPALPAGGPAIINFTSSGTTPFELDMQSDGTIKCFCASATPSHAADVLAATTWYWIDVQADTRTSTPKLQYRVTRISDNVIISETNHSTGGITNADITAVIFGDGSALNANYDDIHLTDSTLFPLVPNIRSLPLDGSWELGQQVYVAVPTSGGYAGYVCTARGNPGTWKGFGVIA